MKHRYTFMAMIMVDADSKDENELTELLCDDALEGIISDSLEIAMETHEIEGEVYHVHVGGDPHSEEVE